MSYSSTMKVLALGGFLMLTSLSAVAQTAIDGDSFKVGTRVIRLEGIDAPELKQKCPDGWPAGELAEKELQKLISEHYLDCDARGVDRYGRRLSVCWADGIDIGAEMVRRGMAFAFTKFSVAYVDQQAEATTAHRGVHRHDCEPPWEYRARGHVQQKPEWLTH